MTSKSKKSLPYKLGTLFVVPLKTSGFAPGIVARLAGNGPVFGYFFGPKQAAAPGIEELIHIAPKDAVWCGQFGDLGLMNREWPIIGELPAFKIEDWPLPCFIRLDDTSGRAIKVRYSDTLEVITEEFCVPTNVEALPRDALSGSGAVESRLTRILAD